MAKKGIETEPGYDKAGRWCITIRKKRGRLTLDEIRQAAREWRKRNRDKTKEYARRYWEKKAATAKGADNAEKGKQGKNPCCTALL